MTHSQPIILFCADPLHPRSPDEVYSAEVEAVRRVEAPYSLISYEALVNEHDAMRAVRSRFYTMDLARRQDGSWLIVELGDGQVAGLPDRADANDFYAALIAALCG